MRQNQLVLINKLNEYFHNVIKKKLTLQNPVWIETLVFSSVIGLHLFLVTDILSANVIYLGGDTTREAWRALSLLSKGQFVPDEVSAFISGFHCIVFIPFIIFFQNTTLCLKIAGITLTLSTVCVLYFFIRRTYGLLSAFFAGCLIAASPGLLAHCTLISYFAAPLYIGIILIMESINKKQIIYLQAFTVGFFTSLHPYIIFPFFGYLIGRISKSTFRVFKLKEIIKCIIFFLMGLIPYAYKFIFYRNTSFNKLNISFNHFVKYNSSRWIDIPAVLKDTFTQLSWSLDSFKIYVHINQPFLFSFFVILWFILIITAFLHKESRRWAVSFISGLIFAGFFVSTHGGLGVRHVLTFMPFLYLIPAAMISKISWRIGKISICILVIILAIRYCQIDYFYIRKYSPEHISANFEHLTSFISRVPDRGVKIFSDSDSLYFGLKFFVPEKNITIAPIDTIHENTDFILLIRNPDSFNLSDFKNKKFFYVGKFFIPGKNIYTLLYEI